MQVDEKPLEFYIDKLKNGEHFSFTRWGDGEWGCALGVQGKNCDGHEYFPEMREDLTRALINHPKYYKATWPLNVPMFSRLGPTINETCKTYALQNWMDARVWEEAAMADKLKPLIEQLDKMHFVMVSEKSKKDLPFIKDFIEVPKKNCYEMKTSIIAEMIAVATENENVVFGLSASMATNVIVDILYDVIGDKCWMIDFGSIWDPYVGNITRTYHRRYKTTEL